MSPERFVRIALTATFRNPKLLRCSQESFLNCLLQLGAMGIEPDGRRAHLIPYGDECTVIVDYKGIAEMLRRNRDVVSIHCDVVGANDHFEVRFGTRGILDHVPSLRDRGAPVCAYSWVKLPDGTEEYDIMGIDEIEAIRKRSKTPDNGPWKTDWNEMAKKTVFRRHSKTLPLSPQTREALEREQDGDALTENERFAAAMPVKSATVAELPRRRGRPPKATNQPPDEEPPDNALSMPAESPGPAAPPAGAAAPQGDSGDFPEPGGPTLDELVLAKVEQAGFSEAEMLTVLKEVRLIDPDVASLQKASGRALQMILDEWASALRRLQENRAKATPKPK
jgi:recombination protein RecT